ncbi:hypothetical protein BDV97DRAFT_18672 [Delphinella strobiligena]|nr:hypothetical protein BDV97DRAFT_18672 [Delphinella strobiligena]
MAWHRNDFSPCIGKTTQPAGNKAQQGLHATAFFLAVAQARHPNLTMTPDFQSSCSYGVAFIQGVSWAQSVSSHITGLEGDARLAVNGGLASLTRSLSIARQETSLEALARPWQNTADNRRTKGKVKLSLCNLKIRYECLVANGKRLAAFKHAPVRLRMAQSHKQSMQMSIRSA